MQSIAVLASGGDAPGMNACIRTVVRTTLQRGALVWGVEDGFDGLVNHHMAPLTSRGVAGILQRGGSILGAGRCEAFLDPECQQRCVVYLREQGIEGVVVIGGDGSMAGGKQLHRWGMPAVIVPGTIDNDMPGTSLTIGADTAINTAMDAIDRIRDTASSHHRVMVVEVMGRHSGFIAVQSGLATGAEMIITPERLIKLDDVFNEMEAVWSRGKRHFIIVMAEGAQWGADELARLINDADNPYEARYTVLGYTQRGGSPSRLDRILATRMGVAAVDALLDGQSDVLVSWRRNGIEVVPADMEAPRANPWSEMLDRVQQVTTT
jgi:6-phosphofructokinase 1